MNNAKPSPLLRPGMDFVAYELDRQIQLNSELSEKVRELENKVSELEAEIEDLKLQS